EEDAEAQHNSVHMARLVPLPPYCNQPTVYFRPSDSCPSCPSAKRPASAKKVRKVSLSLDVPTHILKILLDLDREKEMQAKAAANAELMARLGRRK
uniref:Corticotropin-releasing factor domain-containing protein n=1 Tax=Strix occidentalis caurina TaxID=311401 RepID=A0A8D0EXV4_STROC